MKNATINVIRHGRQAAPPDTTSSRFLGQESPQTPPEQGSPVKGRMPRLLHSGHRLVRWATKAGCRLVDDFAMNCWRRSDSDGFTGSIISRCQAIFSPRVPPGDLLLLVACLRPCLSVTKNNLEVEWLSRYSATRQLGRLVRCAW